MHRGIESEYLGDRDRSIELIARAELRLVELNRLHTENRWKNINPVEAQKQLGTLFFTHDRLLKLLKIESGGSTYLAKHPEAHIFLKIRALIGQENIEDVFQDSEKSIEIRRLRNEMLALQNRTSLSDVYLYRLFLSDPEGRFDFETRLTILDKIKLEDRDLFLQFWHDEAALYCQTNKLDIGARKLRELGQFRRNNREQWFWLNEKALLSIENPREARELVLEVTDPYNGWAEVRGTEIRVKYQPWQFSEMQRRQPFKSHIRITLNGLQAVPEDRIENDLEDMGIKEIQCNVK
jgi:hypothetical protein